MPYPNQHSCRLINPSAIEPDSFRTLKTKTKGLKIIVGKKKSDGKTEVQSYHYDKTIWDEKRAQNHCSKHSGKFEPAKKTTKKTVDITEKDYLQLNEITPDLLKTIKFDVLYRTHAKLHEMREIQLSDDEFKKVESTHEQIVNELKSRKMIHPKWDLLDEFYN